MRVGSRTAPIPFDWTDPAGWPAAVAGVDRVYLSYQPDVAAPGAESAVSEFVGVARRGGVRRVVLLSGRGEPEARAVERIVAAAGLEHTVLRCSWFAQNFSEDYLLEPVLAGAVALPAGNVPEPFVDADDIADAAVAALTGDGHDAAVYELTGPRALTFAEAVATIADVAGRPISFEQVPIAGYADALAAEGVPGEVAGLLEYLFGTVLDGRNSAVCTGVEEVLHRAPTDFLDWAKGAAEAWSR